MLTLNQVKIDGESDQYVDHFTFRSENVMYIVEDKDQIRIRLDLGFWLYTEDTFGNESTVRQIKGAE